MSRAILLSGGMDSFSLIFKERPELAVTIDYGQRPASREIEVSTLIANRLGIEHLVVKVDLSALGSGDLSDKPALESAPASEWWPFRNQALITIAAMATISKSVNELLIATVKSDSVHRDGHVEFVDKMSEILELQEGSMKVSAPAIVLSTPELVHDSKIPLGLLAWSHSCHTANIACGDCRGCWKRSSVLRELRVTDVA